MISLSNTSASLPIQNPFLSIIVPAFNEEQRIGSTIKCWARYLAKQSYTWEVLIINDGSTDSTVNVINQVAENLDMPIRVESIPHGGKGWAVRHGMLAANGEYRFMCDADMAMPINQLVGFLDHMAQGCDVVIGSRQIKGARRFGETPWRHAMGRIFNWSVRLLAVKGFQDTQCGFKCFRGDVAEKLFRQQRNKGFSFDVEILRIAIENDLRVIELPIDWYHNTSSKVRPYIDSFLMLRDTIYLKIRSNRDEHKPHTKLNSCD